MKSVKSSWSNGAIQVNGSKRQGMLVEEWYVSFRCLCLFVVFATNFGAFFQRRSWWSDRSTRHAFRGLTDACVEVDGVLLTHESPGDDGLEEEAMCV